MCLFIFAADSHYHMFITLLVGQAALIIILICALVHWVRKRNRENSTQSPLDRSDSIKTDDDINTTCKYLLEYIYILA